MQHPTPHSQPNQLQNRLLCEPLLLFIDVARRYRNPSGRPLHVSTLHRWRDTGISGVRLEAIRYGGRWMTSIEALDRFMTGLNAARVRPEPSTSPKPHKPVAAIERELAAEGL